MLDDYARDAEEPCHANEDDNEYYHTILDGIQVARRAIDPVIVSDIIGAGSGNAESYGHERQAKKENDLFEVDELSHLVSATFESLYKSSITRIHLVLHAPNFFHFGN